MDMRARNGFAIRAYDLAGRLEVGRLKLDGGHCELVGLCALRLGHHV